MSLLPKIRAQYGEGIGVELFFAFPDVSNEEKTYLEADTLAGATSFSASGVNFAANQYIVAAQPGNEKTEILQINGTPTSTSIALVVAAVFPHNRGDIVRFIPYNQITPERSTDGGTTFSALSAINIRPDASETYLQRTGDASTDVYRFRFSNSTSGLFSAYSASATASGFADNTVWSVKHRALDQLGEQISGLISDSFLNDSLMEGRRWADYNPSILRWSFRTKMGVVIGQMLAGQWSIAAPTDLRDRNSMKNIISLRFGAQNRPINYQDRRRFNQNYLNVVHTTVATAYVSGGTSLVLSSSHDLDASGSITVANNAVGDGLITVTYSANNKTTNTLTITNAGRNIAAGTDVWQRAVVGTGSVPNAYTIDNAMLYFDSLIGTQYDGQDLKGDYYKAIPVIATDADTFDEPFYDLYVPWLKWKIKYKKSNGKIDRESDPDYQDWISGLTELIGQEVPGQMVNFVPDIEGFLSSEG